MMNPVPSPPYLRYDNQIEFEGYFLVTDVSFWTRFREKETTYSRHRKQMGENNFYPKIEKRISPFYGTRHCFAPKYKDQNFLRVMSEQQLLPSTTIKQGAQCKKEIVGKNSLQMIAGMHKTCEQKVRKNLAPRLPLHNRISPVFFAEQKDHLQ